MAVNLDWLRSIAEIATGVSLAGGLLIKLFGPAIRRVIRGAVSSEIRTITGMESSINELTAATQASSRQQEALQESMQTLSDRMGEVIDQMGQMQHDHIQTRERVAALEAVVRLRGQGPIT